MKLTSLLSLGLLAFSVNTYAAKVDITNPTPGDLGINETFVLNISGTEFQSGLPVQGGGFKISYDTSVLELVSVLIDGRLTGGFDPDYKVWDKGDFTGFDVVEEEYFFSKFPNDGPSTGSFNIGNLSFKTIGFGDTTVTLLPPVVYEWAAKNSSGVYPNANLIQYGSVGLSIVPPITSVPVPAAAWLFGTGLLAFGSSFRRNRLA